MTATPVASWKTPRVLQKHLGTWAARDDTRPDPKARAAATDALAAVADMIAELAALGLRLEREIAEHDGQQQADAEAVRQCNTCPAPASCGEFGHCVLEQAEADVRTEPEPAEVTPLAPRPAFCLGHLREDDCAKLAAQHAPGGELRAHMTTAAGVTVSGGWPARYAGCAECGGTWYEIPADPAVSAVVAAGPDAWLAPGA